MKKSGRTILVGNKSEAKELTSVIGRAKRVEQLERMKLGDLVAYSQDLGFRNIQFKKANEDPSKAVNREKKDIATLVYFKELELNI